MAAMVPREAGGIRLGLVSELRSDGKLKACPTNAAQPLANGLQAGVLDSE
jgi:hypothetical protein